MVSLGIFVFMVPWYVTCMCVWELMEWLSQRQSACQFYACWNLICWYCFIWSVWICNCFVALLIRCGIVLQEVRKRKVANIKKMYSWKKSTSLIYKLSIQPNIEHFCLFFLSFSIKNILLLHPKSMLHFSKSQ